MLLTSILQLKITMFLNLTSVSYTHLDVYKRQAEYNAVFRIAVYLLVFKLSQVELIICFEQNNMFELDSDVAVTWLE